MKSRIKECGLFISVFCFTLGLFGLLLNTVADFIGHTTLETLFVKLNIPFSYEQVDLALMICLLIGIVLGILWLLTAGNEASATFKSDIKELAVKGRQDLKRNKKKILWTAAIAAGILLVEILVFVILCFT